MRRRSGRIGVPSASIVRELKSSCATSTRISWSPGCAGVGTSGNPCDDPTLAFFEPHTLSHPEREVYLKRRNGRTVSRIVADGGARRPERANMLLPDTLASAGREGALRGGWGRPGGPGYEPWCSGGIARATM